MEHPLKQHHIKGAPVLAKCCCSSFTLLSWSSPRPREGHTSSAPPPFQTLAYCLWSGHLLPCAKILYVYPSLLTQVTQRTIPTMSELVVSRYLLPLGVRRKPSLGNSRVRDMTVAVVGHMGGNGRHISRPSISQSHQVSND